MLYSTLTSKGQVTIPLKVREELNLKAGDKLIWIINNHKVHIFKAVPNDFLNDAALTNSLNEWNSSEDDEAYKNL